MGVCPIAIDSRGIRGNNSCMQKTLISLCAGLCLALVSGLSAAEKAKAEEDEEKVKVAGYDFSPPAGWKSSPPSSSMRKAQFAAGEAEVVFFYFGPRGGGGVRKWGCPA